MNWGNPFLNPSGPICRVSIRKGSIAFQIKAAALLKPQAQQGYIEDFNRTITPSWVSRCPLRMDTI